MLRCGVGARGWEGDVARDRDDVDDVGRRRRLEAGEEGAQAPDSAEVVHAHDFLDRGRLAVDEGRPARDACIVDEQVDARMPLEHASRDGIDHPAIGDVADLELAADLIGE